MNLLHSDTFIRLSRAVLPSDVSWFDVVDHKLGAEQKALLAKSKKTFGVEEESTFCIGDKEGERIIIQPKLVRDGDDIAIKWGKNTYPLELDITGFEYEDGKPVAVIGGYYIGLNMVNVSKIAADKQTNTQKVYLNKKEAVDKLKYLKGLSRQKLAELLKTPGGGFVKLSELDKGEYVVVDYKSEVSPQYGLKYKLILDDGRQVNSNTAVGRICGLWMENEVEVSEAKPATLIVGKSKQLASGNTMVAVELYSHQDMELEPFDFSLADDKKVDDLEGLFAAPSAVKETQPLDSEQIPF